jgi:ABC-2 type transport system ATP-binding protein
MIQPNAAAIVVENVRKSFPRSSGFAPWLASLGRPPRRTVLHDVSLSVARGELFALLGPNGAGKTTLLKLLATLAIPDRGRIVIDGIDTAHDPIGAQQRIGLCTSEERSFYFRLTARGNLEFFGALAGLRGNALNRRIREVVELVDLRASIDQRFESYSSGMRQRLTVARALLADPEVLLLDEPTRAVDPIHAEAIRALIREELVGRQGKTVVLATNLLEEAWRMCDRVAIINDGRIVALGPPLLLDQRLQAVRRFDVTLDGIDEDLLARTRSIRGFESIAITNEANGVKLTVTVQISDSSLTDLLRALTANGRVLRDFRPVESQPADVFKNVMQVGTDV